MVLESTMGSEELIRTFVAVEAASELCRTLDSFRAELEECGADVKWVEPHQYHITLKFLGNTPAQQVPDVVKTVQDVVSEIPAFQMTLRGAGAFPNLRKPNVIWVGVTEGADRLAELAAAVDRGLERLGFEPEQRPFRAHLTIGRTRSLRGVGPLCLRLAEARDIHVGQMDVAEVVVMKSVLTPKGPIYTRLGLGKLAEKTN